jgi:hypothetical protein
MAAGRAKAVTHQVEGPTTISGKPWGTGVIRSFKQKEPTMTVHIYIYRLVGMAEIYTPPPILLHSFHNTGNLK